MRDAKASALLDGLADDVADRLKKRSQPCWTSPMLATLVDEPFSDPAWIYERKLDGERCLAFRSGGSVRLMSRNRKSLNETYPEIADALKHQEVSSFKSTARSSRLAATSRASSDFRGACGLRTRRKLGRVR